MDYQTATTERARHAGEYFDAPDVGDLGYRKPQRICSTFDLMHRRGHIDADQMQAGEQFAGYWRTVHDVGGVVGAYGDQRWNGTPVSQVCSGLLNGQERKQHCRSMIAASEDAIDDQMLWAALVAVVEADGTASAAGKAIGYSGRDRSQAAGMVALRAGLQRLSRFYAKPRGRPKNP